MSRMMFTSRTHAIRDTIILAGSGRSGTTWLGNIIAANPNVRTIFEPFDHRRVPEAADLPLFAYARPDGDYPQWARYVEQVLSGQIENDWINRQGRRWWASRALVKAIRANLMLGWIARKFGPKIVFMTRHPCAVVLSRMKLEWDTHLDVFLAQPELMHDYLSPYVDAIRGATTEIEKQAAMWCAENMVPLRQLSSQQWVFCSYEQMYQDPAGESARILHQLNLRETWFTRRAVRQVTEMARPGSAVLHQKNPLIDWQHALSTHDIDVVLQTLEKFDIHLYTDDPMPHMQSVVP